VIVTVILGMGMGGGLVCLGGMGFCCLCVVGHVVCWLVGLGVLRGRSLKKGFDSFQNHSKNISPKTGKFLIPIKYRNCYFFSVS
jgi:hypothetical protein